MRSILEVAKGNLAKSGFLAPMVFLHNENGDLIVWPPEKLSDSAQKRKLFFNRGLILKAKGFIVSEALLLIESWGVFGDGKSIDRNTPPSENPHRQELITLQGRNVANSTQVLATVPFSRDSQARMKGLFGRPPVTLHSDLGPSEIRSMNAGNVSVSS